MIHTRRPCVTRYAITSRPCSAALRPSLAGLFILSMLVSQLVGPRPSGDSDSLMEVGGSHTSTMCKSDADHTPWVRRTEPNRSSPTEPRNRQASETIPSRRPLLKEAVIVSPPHLQFLCFTHPTVIQLARPSRSENSVKCPGSSPPPQRHTQHGIQVVNSCTTWTSIQPPHSSCVFRARRLVHPVHFVELISSRCERPPIYFHFTSKFQAKLQDADDDAHAETREREARKETCETKICGSPRQAAERRKRSTRASQDNTTAL
ncbi:hypothetical protein V8E53_006346 [Lactarius tabidus]